MKRGLIYLLSGAMCLSILAGCGKTDNASEPPAATPEADTVVAVVDGHEIMYSQLAEQMVTLEAMYSSLTEQLSKEEIQEKLHDGAMNSLENLIAEQILRTKIDANGITLTKQEREEAEGAWDKVLSSVSESVQKSYPDLEGDDLDSMIQIALEGSGLSEETVVDSAEQSAMVAKLQEQVTGQAAVAPEDVEKEYQRLCAEQQETFSEDATAFESAMIAGDPVVYVPADYRVIQEIDLRFDDEVIQLLAQMKPYDTEDSDSYEEVLEAEYQRLRQGALPQLRKRLAAGEPFTRLMEEIKPGSSSVFNYVSEKTTRLSSEYYETAMSIAEPGMAAEDEITQEYGYAVLYWADTLQPGVRELEQVRDDIEAGLLQKAKSQLWTDTLAQWRQEADVEIYEERLGY